MTEIDLQVSDGTSARAELYSAPAAAPFILLFHEWWGVNDDMRDIAAAFNTAGYHALLLDVYRGHHTDDPARAFELANDMKTSYAIEVAKAAQRFVASDPLGDGRTAVTGFCLGGALTLAAACAMSEPRAFVPFYGVPRAEYARWEHVTRPILGHYAKGDAFAPPERAMAARDAVIAAGGRFELHEYEGRHAFMRKRDATAYHEPSATLAWQRTLAFLAAAFAT